MNANSEPVSGCRIVSLGAARGEDLVPNEALVEAIDSSDEWIRKRTGIITRARARNLTNTADLAIAAACEALEAAAVSPGDVDLVIVSTLTNFQHTPSVAALVSAHIGSHQAATYDLNAACAGYTTAIAQADAAIKAGLARNALVVGSEKLSEIVEPTDRSISFLLGDGAGAAVLTATGAAEAPGVLKTVWGGDSSNVDKVGLGGSTTDFRDGGGWPTLQQEGRTVFRWAVWEMAKVARKILRVNSIAPEELAAFVPHQANMRIVDQLASELKLPENVIVADDIRTTGNTSSASIPLAMHRLLQEHPRLSGGWALQIGFGAGLVYAGQIVRLP